MKVIKYRKIVALGRLFIAFFIVLMSVSLLYPAFNSDAIAPRKVLFFLAACCGCLIFRKDPGTINICIIQKPKDVFI